MIVTSLDEKGFEELEKFITDLQLKDTVQDREGALIEVLHKSQSIFGFLPAEVQEFVASQLKLSLGHVYGVISFYAYFTTEPKGEFEINFCTGTACFVRGADKVIARFEELIGIKMGEVSEDKKISLGHLRCVGACSLAPVVMVNDKTYGNVTPEMVPEIIADCQ
jgi:NADH-quinone oxidoreductase subunit E